MSLEEIKEQALKLSPDEREVLAQEIWDSLDEEPLDPALKAELDRRWEEIQSGKVKTIPHDEVMEHARAAIEKVREEKALSSGSRS
jgi:putative addiction module component (TIGR02574 family)